MAKQKTNQVVFDYEPETFSIIANPIIDDENITPAALSLYVIIRRWITFKVDGFVCSKAFIASKYNAGSRMFNRAWDELKEAGYLKMYSHPSDGWKARLLSTAQPDVPHTFYLDLNGEVKSTNIERAAKKAAKEAEEKKNDHYLQNVPNGDHYLQNDSNGNDSNGNDSNGNVGNNINTSFKDFNNSFDNNYPSINHSEEPKQPAQQPKKKNDRWIDGTKKRIIDNSLVEDVRDQIEYDILKDRYDTEMLDTVVSCIADLYTVSEPQEFSGSTYAPEFVQRRSLEINKEHVDYVFECFEQQRDKVRNVRKYLRSAIFNAPATMEVYYSNAVRAAGLI